MSDCSRHSPEIYSVEECNYYLYSDRWEPKLCLVYQCPQSIIILNLLYLLCIG
jgi:hypothetical protein